MLFPTLPLRLRRLGCLLLLAVGLLCQPRLAAGSDTGRRIQSLDGTWQIAPDPQDQGRSGHWFEPARFPAAHARPILVPGNINEAWPNPAVITDPSAANLDWYCLTFTPEPAPGLRRYLRFGAVRYLSEIWLNGRRLGAHEGGEDPFELEVTSSLMPGRPNALVVRVASPYFGGINQHVSLVAQPDVRIVDAFARPDAARKEIRLEVALENHTASPATVDVTADWGEFRPRRALGTRTVRVTAAPGPSTATLVLPVAEVHLWSLEQPALYTIQVTSRWSGAGTPAAGRDDYALRTGFRDFRVMNGYFYLNGKRIFLKSTHGNWYDPVVIQGTPRTMTSLDRDLPQLKKAGFNTMRFIVSAALPEQLDLADENGLLVYSEHETSWQLYLKDPAKFGITLNQVVRRDRNHPSLVMWGLLNETHAGEMYRRAKAWLPSLRQVDDTRVVLLSSGRWDQDFATASVSNPGSSTWNVYLGGEGPPRPRSTGEVELAPGQKIVGTGDFHIYARYPTGERFASDYSRLARTTQPFFQSELGDGSSYNPFDEARLLKKAGAPPTAYAWSWVNAAVAGLQATWRTYALAAAYPSIEDMLVDSALAQSRQRALTFSLVRGNPRVIGFNLTSQYDCWGTGEGIMDTFRNYKPGHLRVLQEGWAPLRWCLLAHPTNVYAGEPLHLRAALANEDQWPAGSYPASLKIVGPSGVVWRTSVTVAVPPGPAAPMAILAADEDVILPDGLPAGSYQVEAELTGRANAAASRLAFTVSRPPAAESGGAVTVLGLEPAARQLLQRTGATIHEYAAGEHIDREVILVGGAFSGRAADWRALYARCAQGAHVVFLSPAVFLTGAPAKSASPHWLPLASRGTLNYDRDWLYHKDVVAKSGPAFSQLPTKLMTPETYAGVLSETPYFSGVTTPDQTEAVAIRCVGIIGGAPGAGGPGFFEYRDGVMLGTYRYHAGHFTLNALNILGQIGQPAADRLLLNLTAEARADARPVQPLPADFPAEIAALQ